jgi:hypothetical protein
LSLSVPSPGYSSQQYCMNGSISCFVLCYCSSDGLKQNFCPTWFMHRSCHAFASQLSFNLIAIVIQSHRNCHSITSQLSFNLMAIVIQSHHNCHVIASQLRCDNYVPRNFNFMASKIHSMGIDKILCRTKSYLYWNEEKLQASEWPFSGTRECSYAEMSRKCDAKRKRRSGQETLPCTRSKFSRIIRKTTRHIIGIISLVI